MKAVDQTVVKPIFILSEFRSGSTLLRYLLDAHPSVCCPAELLIGAFCLQAFHVVELTTDTGVEVTRDTQMERASRVRQMVDRIMDPYCARKGKQRWCEKSPANIDVAFLLSAVFPDAQYICLHRHALDQVASVLNIEGTRRLQPHLARYPGDAFAAALDKWCGSTEKLLAWEHSNPGVTVRLTYEDLVSSPAEEMGRVLAFLGLSLVSDLHEAAFKCEHDRGPGDMRIAKSTGIQRDRVGRGRNIDTKVPSALRSRMIELLDALNYGSSGVAGR